MRLYSGDSLAAARARAPSFFGDPSLDLIERRWENFVVVYADVHRERTSICPPASVPLILNRCQAVVSVIWVSCRPDIRMEAKRRAVESLKSAVFEGCESTVSYWLPKSQGRRPLRFARNYEPPQLAVGLIDEAVVTAEDPEPRLN